MLYNRHSVTIGQAIMLYNRDSVTIGQVIMLYNRDSVTIGQAIMLCGGTTSALGKLSYQIIFTQTVVFIQCLWIEFMGNE